MLFEPLQQRDVPLSRSSESGHTVLGLPYQGNVASVSDKARGNKG